MNKFLILSLAQFLFLSSFAQKTTRIEAMPTNNYGVIYNLPKTAISVTIDYEKITLQAGPYAAYAKKYLGITDAISKDQTYYNLESVEASEMGVKDEENNFFVEFKPNSAMSFVSLSPEGFICAINEDCAAEDTKESKASKPQQVQNLSDANNYLTQEIIMATTGSKKAELIARQIYNLRENRNDILSGDVDNLPTDDGGFSILMAKIDEQEQALTSLFIGTKKIEQESKTIVYNFDDSQNREIVARFSEKFGVVSKDNLVGKPIYITIENDKSITPTIELNPKDITNFEKKLSSGIVYNIPKEAAIIVEYDGKKLVSKNISVVQFGTKDVLTQKVLSNKKGSMKVNFHPNSGSIKSIHYID